MVKTLFYSILMPHPVWFAPFCATSKSFNLQHNLRIAQLGNHKFIPCAKFEAFVNQVAPLLTNVL